MENLIWPLRKRDHCSIEISFTDMRMPQSTTTLKIYQHPTTSVMWKYKLSSLLNGLWLCRPRVWRSCNGPRRHAMAHFDFLSSFSKHPDVQPIRLHVWIGGCYCKISIDCFSIDLICMCAFCAGYLVSRTVFYWPRATNCRTQNHAGAAKFRCPVLCSFHKQQWGVRSFTSETKTLDKW